MADDDRDAPRLTLAGTLLCTREPQRWLPHAYVQAVSYAGERTDVEYQMDARDIGGPLDEQVAEALHFVRRNMLVRGSKSTACVERPQFSERAVFEALVNAVAHRDYTMAGARVRLHMFADRLELHVPGALANALFLAEICGMEYVHLPELAPTKEMLDEYKKGGGDWETYETRFLDLMHRRRIEKSIPEEVIADGCLLCSEDKPHHCHRRLVAEYLDDRLGGVEIVHLG